MKMTEVYEEEMKVNLLQKSRKAQATEKINKSLKENK